MSSPDLLSSSSPLIICLLLIVSANDLGSEMVGLADKDLHFDTLEALAFFRNDENY